MSKALKDALLVGTALILTPAAASAQQASPSTAADANQPGEAPAAAPSPTELAPETADDTSTGVADVVVTATRRETNLQKVPISVVAVSSETITQLNIENTADLPQVAPGLTVVRSGGLVPFIRGVGASNAGFTTESPVAVYLDGVYLANSSSGLFSFNSISRIEVLKGPQGTLYGRNSTGGLINVITKSPGDKAEIDGSVGYANYDTFTARLYGSTPLTDNLSFNSSVVYSNQARGFGKNVFTGNDVMKEKEFGLLSKLLWKPGLNTRVELRGLYNYNWNDLGLALAIIPGARGVDGTPYLGKYRIASRQDPYSRLHEYSTSLKIEQDLSFAKLMSLTAYTYADQPLSFTQSGIPGQPATGRSAIETRIFGRGKTFTQELQLSSPSGSRLQWIAGAFYLRDDTKVQLDSYGTCVGTTCAGAPVPTRTTGYPKTRSISGFGEATYDITDALHVTAGLRYTSDKKSLSGLAEPLGGLPNSPASLPSIVPTFPGAPYPGNPAGIPKSVTFSKVTFKGVVAYDFTDRIHYYVSFNRGFKSGGYNPITFANPPSRPEVLDAWESGLKSDLFNRMLRLNLSVFRYSYKDIQLRSTAPPAPVGGTILFNAAAAKEKGFDAEFNFVPTRSLKIIGNFEYLDAHYSSFPGGTCITPRPIGGAVLGGSTATPCDLSGARMIQAPKYSYSLGFVYTRDTPIGTFALAANDSYKSRYKLVFDGRIDNDPYHLVNTSLTWTHPNGHYDIQLFAKNLTGSYYYVVGQGATGGNDLYIPGAPRTYGVTAGFRF